MTTMDTLDAQNADLRAAVEARLSATTETPEPEPAIPVDWILQGEAELKAQQKTHTDPVYQMASLAEPAGASTVARETLEQAIAAVDDRHLRYGPPAEHFSRTAALVNAAFGTSFTASDWALVMVLDKVARQRGPAATDDAAIDIAGYAACHQECRRLKP